VTTCAGVGGMEGEKYSVIQRTIASYTA